MPVYRLPADELKVKPKGLDKEKGFKSWTYTTDGFVEIETWEEYTEDELRGKVVPEEEEKPAEEATETEEVTEETEKKGIIKMPKIKLPKVSISIPFARKSSALDDKVLQIVTESPEISPVEISEKLGIKLEKVVESLKRLNEAGKIEIEIEEE